MEKCNLLKLACLAGVLCSVGCQSPAKEPSRHPSHAHATEAPVVCPTVSEVSPQGVVGLIWDITGSIQQLAGDQTGRIRADITGLIEHLPPATLVVGHYISADSYRDQGFLRDAIPMAPMAVPCEITNIWDLRQKKVCRQQERSYTAKLACVTAARERMTGTLRDLMPARAEQTDLWGAMVVASEIMHAYAHSRRLLIVYSDLEDNVLSRQHSGKNRKDRRALPPLLPALPGLQGVTIVVRAPRTNPAAAARHLAAFQRHVAGWGATVTVLPFEVPWQGALNNNS